MTSIVPYIALWALAAYLYEISIWWTIPVVVLNAGMFIRMFIIFHDCGHQSFFKSRRANDFWGMVTGVLTFTPYHYWRANHAKHHATSADLDKRGYGDVWMMTVGEYVNAPFKERLKYRLYRNPFIMFILGPVFITLVTHRLVRRDASKREKRSVYITNAALLGLAIIASYFMGVWHFVFIQFITLFVALMIGVWLFYVQHQFEGVYWARSANWDFLTASIEGGSFYDLPPVLRWFTGSIGYHHVHHLNPRIPNYNLAACHDQIPELKQVNKVTLLSSLKSLNYRLWDEEEARLVSFRGIGKRIRAATANA